MSITKLKKISDHLKTFIHFLVFTPGHSAQTMRAIIKQKTDVIKKIQTFFATPALITLTPTLIEWNGKYPIPCISVRTVFFKMARGATAQAPAGRGKQLHRLSDHRPIPNYGKLSMVNQLYDLIGFIPTNNTRTPTLIKTDRFSCNCTMHDDL